jgi:hypothetical protein
MLELQLHHQAQSTANFQFSSLPEGKHHYKSFKNSWNKYIPQSFDTLHSRELFWLAVPYS